MEKLLILRIKPNWAQVLKAINFLISFCIIANKPPKKEVKIENVYYWGVDETTHLMTQNGLEDINKIQIGDKIWNSDREIWDEVRGIVKIDKTNVRMVKLVKNGFELNELHNVSANTGEGYHEEFR